MQGVIARGIKTPIIKAFDDLALVVTNSILETAKNENFKINNNDIIAITEGVVAIADNNFASVDEVATDIKNKLNYSKHIGVVYPIFSRNRFSIILKAIARSTDKVTILMPYPFDEVGNPNLAIEQIKDIKLVDDIVENVNLFNEFRHPYTNVNIIEYYSNIVLEEKKSVEFIFSNNPKVILNYTKDLILCEVHNRELRKNEFLNKANVIDLSNIMDKPVGKSGFNQKYGLLGANVSTFESLKLFPKEDYQLLNKIQEIILNKTNKHVEVMIFGDGAFKDPSSGIWELADPVVSPFYTKGLVGSPSEVKIKMLVATKYQHLEGLELEEAINQEIANKNKNELEKLGTTPRKYIDLIGSLADLIAGSGDKKTPVVLIQNYLK
ncbi:MAG TPA: F420-0--gamma-glutamyl ligase [Acholeplasmataceae bacterium]|nr:F420-0--gamma-glutamyl ligase [Acholeplasmataceae bacterium]